MLGVAFFATGVCLVKLRRHAKHSNDCYDLEEEEEATTAETPGALRPCRSCSSGSLRCFAEDESEEDAKESEETACKFCDEENVCRFCFSGPERGELISPCSCVGSQEFVHVHCLRQWQKIAMRTKGNREENCRVCHAKYRLPKRPLRSRAKLWFSFKARDRLNAYSRVWFQSLINLFMSQNKPGTVAGHVGRAATRGLGRLARSNSATELALMMASTEVRIWAGREVRHGKSRVQIVKLLSAFGSAVNFIARMKHLGVV